MVQEIRGIRFEIERCKQNGSSIVCRIFITATGADKRFEIFKESKAVDANGVLYQWRGYQGVGEKGMKQGGVGRSFIADVRTAAQVFFEGEVAEKVASLSAVQIVIYDGSNSTVTFRNVPLE